MKISKKISIAIMVNLSLVLVGIILYLLSIPYYLAIPLILMLFNCGLLASDSEKSIKQICYADPKIELLAVDCMSGIEFEKWCAMLLENLGYTNIQMTKASNDQGVDIIAHLGTLDYAFQCKRYSNNLGNTPVQEVNAGMNFYDCQIGAVMTNQYFTKAAILLAQKNNIQLIDRNGLLSMMKEANRINTETREVHSKPFKKRRNNKMKNLKPEKMWPHCDAVEIDTAYFDSLPAIAPTEDMKDYITAYPLEPNEDPHNLPVDQIITIISEPFDRKDYAEHFAKAVSKHCCSIAEVTEDNGKCFVKIRSHVYSIMSNYFEHGEGTEQTYEFANWS